MELKFTNIYNKTAEIRLYKHFGNDSLLGMGVDGNDVANEINYINECCPDVENIDIKINSTGGDVQHGLSVCSAILDSKIPVTTWNKGMCYSIAGVVLMCGSKRNMVDFGTFMMHDASGSADNEVLDLITNSLAKIFERTTSLTIDKCRELMAKETWMSAEECKIYGLIDNIVPTNNKRPNAATALELFAFYNKHINKKPMIKLTNLLKLSNEASEDAIVEKVESIEAEKAYAIAELEASKAKIAELEAKVKAFEDIEIAKEEEAKTAVIENAITEGKITSESKEKWVSSPINSIELKNLFESLKTTPVFVNVMEAAKITGDSANDRSSWTYSDWEKKDSAGLLEIQNSNPEEFKRLISTINTTIKSKI